MELEATMSAEIKNYISVGCVHTHRKVCLHQQVNLMQRAYSKICISVSTFCIKSSLVFWSSESVKRRIYMNIPKNKLP